jgi:hypothetical protein
VVTAGGVPFPNRDPALNRIQFYISDMAGNELYSPALAVDVGPPYTLAARPATVAPGGPITVTWTARPASSSLDWIGLFLVGDPNNAFTTWFYTGGATSGSRQVTAPARPGQYEFRYLIDNSLTSVAASNTVTVTGWGGGGYTLTASPNTVARGAPLTVSWTAPAGRPVTDWIGLYKVGDPNHLYLWWQYTGGTTSGSATLPAPNAAGSYEFRYLRNNGYIGAATSNTVTVN